MPTPGSISPDSIPPTDVKTAGVGPRHLDRLCAKAEERRDEALKKGRAATPPLTMLVRPAPGRAGEILDLDGHPYPDAEISVTVDDVYVQRRIRDGSLVRIA